MRDCLSTVGYGGVDGGSLSLLIACLCSPLTFATAQFTGTECDDDSDCIHDCNKEEGICFVSTTKEMESQFLRCWIQTMGTFVEVPSFKLLSFKQTKMINIQLYTRISLEEKSLIPMKPQPIASQMTSFFPLKVMPPNPTVSLLPTPLTSPSAPIPR